jgi:hypothetical protein
MHYLLQSSISKLRWSQEGLFFICVDSLLGTSISFPVYRVWANYPFCNVLLICIIVYQYSETNEMHCLINLLRIKSLYTFGTLLAHLQEVLHKRH